MSKNYYVRSKQCPTCGHSRSEKHIGKSSVGNPFHFRGYEEENLTSYVEWVKELEGTGEIIDEYGTVVPLEELLKRVATNGYDFINHDFC